MIHYQSTRGSKYIKTSAQAIIQGIAEDGGLYVPNQVPALPFAFEEMVGRPYRDVAYQVIKAFFEDYTDEELAQCVDRAYDGKFDTEEIVPVTHAEDGYFLELYHGKTAAFKDMALSIMPHLLATALKKEKEDRQICILTATSGDTGKAALEGFAGLSGTQIVVFYPEDGVSAVQKQQMITQEGDNTHVFALKGNFDDAQTGVKRLFDDGAFGEQLQEAGYRLSSANSINIGRLIPQVAYYVYGYLKLVERGVITAGEEINIVVPTGNFGNILAAYYAGEMGLPVKKFLCASNENNVLTDFLSTGTYNLHREFLQTTSPSMDILISSNLERLLYHLSGGNGKEIAALMESLRAEGKYTVSPKINYALDRFHGGCATMERVRQAIGDMYDRTGYLMDTHTAVGYRVYQDYIAYTGDRTPALIASTASAFKFAEEVARALHITEQEVAEVTGGDEVDGFAYIDALHAKTGVPVPIGLQDLKVKKVRHKDVVTQEEMAEAIQKAL